MVSDANSRPPQITELEPTSRADAPLRSQHEFFLLTNFSIGLRLARFEQAHCLFTRIGCSKRDRLNCKCTESGKYGQRR